MADINSDMQELLRNNSVRPASTVRTTQKQTEVKEKTTKPKYKQRRNKGEKKSYFIRFTQDEKLNELRLELQKNSLGAVSRTVTMSYLLDKAYMKEDDFYKDMVKVAKKELYQGEVKGKKVSTVMLTKETKEQLDWLQQKLRGLSIGLVTKTVVLDTLLVHASENKEDYFTEE